MKHLYSFRTKDSFTKFTWQGGNEYTALEYAELLGYREPKWWQFWRSNEELVCETVHEDYVL